MLHTRNTVFSFHSSYHQIGFFTLLDLVILPSILFVWNPFDSILKLTSQAWLQWGSSLREPCTQSSLQTFQRQHTDCPIKELSLVYNQKEKKKKSTRDVLQNRKTQIQCYFCLPSFSTSSDLQAWHLCVDVSFKCILQSQPIFTYCTFPKSSYMLHKL